MRFHSRAQTQWQKLEIWKSAHEVEFRVEGAVHAWYHQRKFLTGLAWDLIAAGALLGKEPPRSILMLGLAGGTAFRILRRLLPAAELVAVDIDEEIVSLAREHMFLDDLNIEIHISDAYQWLAQNSAKFDVVIDDIYLAGKSDVFRPQVWDAKILGHLSRTIADDGVLAVNLVTGAGHRKMQSFTRRILTANFPQVRAVRSPYAMNEVLVAGKAVAPRSRLWGYEDHFSQYQDKEYWEEMSVRKVR